MECELCFNQWNSDVRIPKILPCGHSYCIQCLYNIIESIKDNPLAVFKCPNCSKELPQISSKKDIMNLQKNTRLLSLLDKIETQKSRTNISNISISQSIPVNTSYLESGGGNITPNLFSKLSNNDDSVQVFNNIYFPLCNVHKNKATFYNLIDGRINYICNECIQSMPLENLNPLPNLKVNNEFKIDSSKNRVKILKEEVEKIQNFLEKYQSNFETENKKKIDELFVYINQIVSYNYTTALTVFNQCKKEQKNQIDKKIKELNFLKNELNNFDKKLDEISDINDKKPEPESQLELDNVFNKLGNYINYENELNLFQMNISIKEEIKDSLFDLIQNAIQLDVDFLKMKNGELPNIKELLNKSSNWSCTCGEQNNQIGKIICNNCSKYRPLETYTNIIFNPMFITKSEKKEYSMRRKHESKVYQSLLKRNKDTSNKEICFYAIEASWLNKWKCFINNDCSEKILSNNEKPISENKNLGVLPPGIINNIKLCDIYKPHGKYRLKSGMKNKKDYFVINQYLWEWFLLNYNGGPEIQVDDYSSSLFCIEEDVGKTENVIENTGTVITYLNNKGDDLSNIGCSEINLDRDKKDENTNKINPINNYNFNTKFSEFRVHNENEKKFFAVKERYKEDKNEFGENKENKENQNTTNNNIILKKKTQIKSLIRNINIEDNKY